MDIVIGYLAVLPLTPGHAHQRFFFWHPFAPLCRLPNIVGCFGDSVKEEGLTGRGANGVEVSLDRGLVHRSGSQEEEQERTSVKNLSVTLSFEGETESKI